MAVKLHNTIITNGHLQERIERKFYLVPQNVGFARGLLQHICYLDTEYPFEQINSLYFDTVDLDQHERSTSGDFGKNKVRIRWYGTYENCNDLETIFIELKTRNGFASTKQRLKYKVPVEALAIANLGEGIISRSFLTDTLARFGYFQPKPLKPIIKISYWRYRFVEIFSGVRVALDYRIRSTMIARELGFGERELELPGGVLEVKGKELELPLGLRNMKILDIDWSRFSKYSSCIDSHGEEPGTVGRLSPSGKIIQL